MSTFTIHSGKTVDSAAFYPMRLTSRAVTRKRTRRIFWAGVSCAFALGCTTALTPAGTLSTWFSRPATEVAANTVPAAESDVPVPVAAAQVIAPPHEIAVAAVVPVEEHYPLDLKLEVQSGDTLISLLTDSGVSYQEARRAVESMRPTYNPKKLNVGQNISVRLDRDKDSDSPVITSLSLPVSLTSALRLTRAGDASFDVKKVNMPIDHKLARAGGTIDSSLYETARARGIPVSVLGEIINAYSYDVDFQRDIQQGDALDAMYEKMQTRDGHDAGTGNLVFAQLDLGDRVLKIYRYVDKDGNADYYNEKGESVRKALLRTPVNGAHITSTFGMRMHPLLGYSRMHRGIDFGAPTGTPIYAAGDGVVAEVGPHGGYGNYLRIRHNNKYETAYGHISRFAAGMAPGRKVKQGQIVAYVGSTGMSTGPHLHYEILVSGDQVNPSSVKFKTGNVLGGKEMLAFRQSVHKIDSQLASIQQGGTTLAMNNTKSPATN